MEYQPLTAVWEVTMGCNMRCGHCGSSCEEPLPHELSTNEALSLCDEIAGLGLRWITLSGGEPLTRKDLPLIIERLSSRGVAVNIITNGWKLDREMAQTLKNSNISTVAISIDGTENLHDKIRRKGSFKRSGEAFGYLKELGITTGAVTTISNELLDNNMFSDLRGKLIDMGVQTWQVQIGLPMGNLKARPDWVIAPERVDEIIDFCYETSMQGRIKIFPADCIGYYTEKEMKVRQNNTGYHPNNIPMWDGCNAGKRGFGILHNGDILGCTSIRNREYIEGSIKEKRLFEIWNNPDGFKWNRKANKNSLGGNCKICIYGNKCIGGCPNTRLTMNGTINSENEYCAYNLAMKRLKNSVLAKNNVDELIGSVKKHIENQSLQAAAFEIERILELEPNNKEALRMQGFVEFMCGNYSKSEAANKKAIELDSNDIYAHKGLGLALHRQGKSNEGVKFIEKAASMTNYSDADIMHDLAIVNNEIHAGMKG